VVDDRGAGLLTCAGCERHKATANRRGICPLVLLGPALLSHIFTRRELCARLAVRETFTSWSGSSHGCDAVLLATGFATARQGGDGGGGSGGEVSKGIGGDRVLRFGGDR